MSRALISSGPVRHWPGVYQTVLETGGFEQIVPPGNDELSRTDLARYLADADAVIAGGEPLDGPLMDEAPRLKVIARVGVGYDSVDVPAATARGIVVTITPGTNQGSVAEHAFALLLAVTRQIARLDPIVRSGGWERPILRPLRGQTLGLIGLGRIGRAIVPRARAFEMPVIACDPVADPGFDQDHDIRRVGLAELLERADVVSLHLPLSTTTYRLLDARAFARMKPGAILINTSRGGLVDESALIESLAGGRLSGAGLDVFDPEPPRADNPLLTFPNVVLAPHLGGQDARSLADMAELACQSVVDLAEGRWPEPCVVNPEVRPRWTWK